MKKYIVLLLLVLSNIMAYAIVYDADNIPIPNNSVEGSVNYISNPDGILTDEACTHINSVLLGMEQKMGIKSLVIAVHSVKDGDLYRFTIDVGNKYGIGSKDNTGIIMAVAIDDREWRIVTGEGMEKYLTDAQASYIGRHYLVPYMRIGEYNEGITALVDAVAESLYTDETMKEQPTTEESMLAEDDDDGFWDYMERDGWIMLVLIGSVLMLVWDVVKWYQRSYNNGICPKCGTPTGIKRDSTRYGVIVKYEYRCETCNKHFHVNVFFFIFLLYYILKIMASARGGGSRGGSRGGRSYGSRGGGSFGGGGAGGKW